MGGEKLVHIILVISDGACWKDIIDVSTASNGTSTGWGGTHQKDDRGSQKADNVAKWTTAVCSHFGFSWKIQSVTEAPVMTDCSPQCLDDGNGPITVYIVGTAAWPVSEASYRRLDGAYTVKGKGNRLTLTLASIYHPSNNKWVQFLEGVLPSYQIKRNIHYVWVMIYIPRPTPQEIVVSSWSSLFSIWDSWGICIDYLAIKSVLIQPLYPGYVEGVAMTLALLL